MGLNRPEPTPPPPSPESRGQAEVLAEVVDTPLFHVGKFGRRKTSEPDPKLRTTRSLAGLGGIRPRAPPRQYYEQGRPDEILINLSSNSDVLP